MVSVEDESSEHRHLRHMMAPTKVTCGYPDCSYVSENDSEQVAILQVYPITRGITGRRRLKLRQNSRSRQNAIGVEHSLLATKMEE